jgi:hypothetical protein
MPKKRSTGLPTPRFDPCEMVDCEPLKIVQKGRDQAMALFNKTSGVVTHMKNRLECEELRNEVKMLWLQCHDRHGRMLASGVGCAALSADLEAQQGLTAFWNMLTAEGEVQAAALAISRRLKHMVFSMQQKMQAAIAAGLQAQVVPANILEPEGKARARAQDGRSSRQGREQYT